MVSGDSWGLKTTGFLGKRVPHVWECFLCDQWQPRGSTLSFGPASLRPHPPSLWTMARLTSWLNKAVACCSGTEPGIWTHEFTNASQTQAQIFPQAKSRLIRDLTAHSWWWQQVLKGSCSLLLLVQVQGYQKLLSRVFISGLNVVLTQPASWAGGSTDPGRGTRWKGPSSLVDLRKKS